jgi:hypothetical protein
MNFDHSCSNIGAVSVLDGTSYPDGGGANNYWLSHFELNAVPVTAAVPEPASLMILGVGLAGMFSVRRRKQRK